jgi:hypothetical protein
VHVTLPVNVLVASLTVTSQRVTPSCTALTSCKLAAAGNIEENMICFVSVHVLRSLP